jgi:hypothetical protein
MKRMLTKTIQKVLLLILAILACSCAVPPGAAQQKQSAHEFLAVLIDTASKKPVPSARVILAPKKEGKHECTIDTSLTGVSNERGEVRIPGVQPGEYVFFYNLSGSLNPGLKGKVVNYDPLSQHQDGQHMPNPFFIGDSLGRHLMTPTGGSLSTSHGRTFFSGHIYSYDLELAVIGSEGGLVTVHIPGSGSAPVRIEISTNLPKPNPPQGAPKSGQ